MPGVTFDEIFYPQYGLQYLSGGTFDSVHPPLGAYLMSLSIYLYYLIPWTDSLVSTGFELSNLDPFSYRWLNAVTGTALIYVSYKVSKELIDNQHFAILVALFFCLDGALIVDKMLLKPCDGFGVKVVGRFVEQKHFRRFEEQFAERNAAGFTA